MRLALALLFVAAVARADVAQAPPPTLATTSERLANGLTVVVHEDPSVSSVAIALRYDSGAADDDAAHAGYAHLLEVLTAQGSVHVKAGEFERRIEDAGGFTTSSTDWDGITFTTQVPAGALELALWLEAERMAGLADGITDAGLAAARDTIAGEYSAAYETTPYALVDRAIDRGLYGPSRDVLVDRQALEKASRADVQRYVRERLVPSNAVLSITGRVDASTALALAKKYASWIPSGTRRVIPSAAVTPLAKYHEEQVLEYSPRVVVAYRTNATDTEDAIAIEVAGHLIAKRVTEANLAIDVRLDVVRSARGGELRITALPSAGNHAWTLRDTILAASHQLATAPPPIDEVRATSAELELEFLTALEGLPYRARVLASALPVDRRLAVLHTLSPDVVQRAAAYWLVDSAAMVVQTEAKGR